MACKVDNKNPMNIWPTLKLAAGYLVSECTEPSSYIVRLGEN